MTTPFSYSTTYILDKSHFSETFDESITADNAKTVYFKAIILALLGLIILLFTQITAYIAWFIVALGAVEVLSIRFRKSWWLARQMISKAANSELTLTVDENGVRSKSFYVESEILWADVKKIEQTAQGWLLYHAGGKNYLSGRCLSAAANEFISAQALLKSQ
ncbi:MAG: hypothetical protein ACJA13_003028 [Paraglaciecola sp.]|jgi:hypothetical protein